MKVESISFIVSPVISVNSCMTFLKIINTKRFLKNFYKLKYIPIFYFFIQFG